MLIAFFASDGKRVQDLLKKGIDRGGGDMII